MRKSRGRDFITNVNKISAISLYQIITFRTKKNQISISFQPVGLI